MKEDCKKAFLIDNDSLANEFHKEQILAHTHIQEIQIFLHPKKAIKSLDLCIQEITTPPSILFYDPDSSSSFRWEYLQVLYYKTRPWKSKIFVLSLFLNAQDLKKAEQSPFLDGFFYKPLTEEIIVLL